MATGAAALGAWATLREGNSFCFLCRSLSFLVKLEQLDLGGNDLEVLVRRGRGHCGRVGLTGELWSLFLLSFQPDTLGALPNLRELWLDRNQLSALPPVSEGMSTPTLHPVRRALTLCTLPRSSGTSGAWCAWMCQRTAWRPCLQSWGGSHC